MMKFKPISGKLNEHFGFKLSSEGVVDNGENVYCLQCYKSFAFHGSNTSLMYHLRCSHHITYQKFIANGNNNSPSLMSSKQCNINQFIRRNDHPISDEMHHELMNSIAHWIASSGRPISIVEDEGLQTVLRVALQNSEYNLPSRRSVDNLLLNIYETKLKEIKSDVMSVNAIALTSDYWTSLGNEAYCGITCHWIDSDWTLQSVVLECVNVVERKYAENIAEFFTTFAADWNLSDKIQAIITDNARNMVSGISQASFNHIPCLAHSIQLSILRGLKAAETETLFTKCRKLVAHFKHSPSNTNELKVAAGDESQFHKLQQDITTRWNSVYIMLKSIFESKDSLTVYMSKQTKNNTITAFSDNDWERISKLLEVLDVYCQATVLLGGDKYVSCSAVLPLLSSLEKHITVNDDDPGYIAKFKSAALNDFKSRVAAISGLQLLQMATMLDPRYKNVKCLTNETKNIIWNIIREKTTNKHNDSLCVKSQTQTSNCAAEMNEFVSQRPLKRAKLMLNESDSDDERKIPNFDEIERYKLEKKIAETENPLLWWKINEQRFPNLASLAKGVLCIPATSVPCERLFSSAGYIVNKTRCSLAPDNVNMLVCLRDWLKKDTIK